MKSPFPGMDPYLERHWGGVHLGLIVAAQEKLNEQLPESLRARVEERVYVEETDHSSTFVPDVYVSEKAPAGSSRRRSGNAGGGSVAIAEPLIINLGREFKHRYLEIRDAKRDERLVTVLEFLSPKNKERGAGRDIYLKKQETLLESEANLVEIDLVRAGQHAVAVPLKRIPVKHRKDYLVCIRRAHQPGGAEVIPISLRVRLPVIPIPLREYDDDISLDLQSCLELVYARGRYDDTDYAKDLDPPLAPADAKWADALLRKKGLR